MERRALLAAISSAMLDVTGYGVVGNGSTDNYASLNTAITAARSAGKGLYFQNGTYNVVGPIDAGGVAFYGQSRSAVLNQPGAPNGLNVNAAQDLTIQNFTVRDYGVSPALSFSNCSFVSTVNDPNYYLVGCGFNTINETIQFSNCTFTYNAIYTALWIREYDSVLVQNCTFNAGNVGVCSHNLVLSEPAQPDAPTQILGNTIYGGTTGILVESSRLTPIVGGLIQANHLYAQTEESISLDGFGNNASLVPVIANGPISSISNNGSGQLVVGMNAMRYFSGQGVSAPAPLSIRSDWTNFYFSFGAGSGLGGTLAHIVSFDAAANTVTLDRVAPASSVTVGGDAGVQSGFFNWTISGNDVHDTLGANNTYGTAISAYLNVFGTTIDNNSITNCAHGVSVAGGLMLNTYQTLAYNNVVSHNIFINCDSYGSGDPANDGGVIGAISYFGGALQYNNQFIDNTITGGLVTLQAQAGITWLGNALSGVDLRTDRMSPISNFVIQDGQSLPDAIDHVSVQFSEDLNLQSLISNGSIDTAFSLSRQTASGVSLPVTVADGTFSYDAARNTLQWQLPAGQSLAAGGYQLQISGVSDSNGNPVASTFTTTFRSAAVTYSRSAWLPVPTAFNASNDSDGTTYTWDFGDQTTGVGASVNHRYSVAGTYTVTLSATDANGTYQRTMTETVAAAPTATNVTTSAIAAGFGQAITFVATISSIAGGGQSGSVRFNIDGALSNPIPLIGNTATFSTSALAVGAHAVLALFSGDTDFTASSSSAMSQSIAPAVTSIAIASGNTARGYGLPVTFTATLMPVSGTVRTAGIQFLIDGADAGNAINIDDTRATLTTSSLSAGTHTIVARYLGDSDFSASTSAALIQVVPPLPSWVAVNSAAAWNDATKTLTVIGPTTIIADPGIGVSPQIIANGASASLAITTAVPSTIHLGGVTLSGGARLTMNDIAGRNRQKINTLMIGKPRAATDPTLTVDTLSIIAMGRNALIVCPAAADSADQSEQKTADVLAATGRTVAPGSVIRRYLDRQWTQVVRRRLHSGFVISSVQVLSAANPAQFLRLAFTR